jgi:hypothetical protein
MVDDYLTMVLEEAGHVAEQHDQVARTTDNQAQETRWPPSVAVVVTGLLHGTDCVTDEPGRALVIRKRS